MATHKAATKKSTGRSTASSTKKSTVKSTTPPARRWSAKVDTDSTHPDHGLFLESAPKIAKALATKRVSPKGPASGMRMLNFYINRAGKNLPEDRLATLRHAKKLLSGIIAERKGNRAPQKSAPKKHAAKKRST